MRRWRIAGAVEVSGRRRGVRRLAGRREAVAAPSATVLPTLALAVRECDLCGSAAAAAPRMRAIVQSASWMRGRFREDYRRPRRPNHVCRRRHGRLRGLVCGDGACRVHVDGGCRPMLVLQPRRSSRNGRLSLR
eukprot:scaffold2668_cov115-Isochrysis_galbana.AAC.13